MIVDMSSEKVQTQFPGLDSRVNSKGYSRVLVVKSMATAPDAEVYSADVILTLDGIILKNRFGPTTEMMQREKKNKNYSSQLEAL